MMRKRSSSDSVPSMPGTIRASPSFRSYTRPFFANSVSVSRSQCSSWNQSAVLRARRDESRPGTTPALPLRDQRRQPGEPRPRPLARARHAEILVDRLDPLRRPAPLQRLLAQAVLQPRRFPVRQHLLRRRLPHVHQRQALEMPFPDRRLPRHAERPRSPRPAPSAAPALRPVPRAPPAGRSPSAPAAPPSPAAPAAELPCPPSAACPPCAPLQAPRQPPQGMIVRQPAPRACGRAGPVGPRSRQAPQLAVGYAHPQRQAPVGAGLARENLDPDSIQRVTAASDYCPLRFQAVDWISLNYFR